MNDYELLDLIGEADEGYVLAADGGTARPRFRWKALAACAACAALALCAYPIYRTAGGSATTEYNAAPQLHSYTVIGGGGDIAEAAGGDMAPAGDAVTEGEQTDESAPAPNPEAPAASAVPETYANGAPAYSESGGRRGDAGADVDGTYYSEFTEDAPVQEQAMAQYDNFWRNLGLDAAQGVYPEWCGGVWIDNGAQPEPRLAVAVAEGFRTPELEAQIIEGCGGEVTIRDVKYPWSHQDGLMDPVTEALKGTDLACSIGLDPMENCLGVDLYGESVPDQVLARLAELDPGGDAIRVRLFVGVPGAEDAPAPPELTVEPVPGGAWIGDDSCEPEPIPAGADGEETFPAAVISLPPEVKERSQPARTEEDWSQH